MDEPEFVIRIRGINWLPAKSAWQVTHKGKYVGVFVLGELEGQAAKKKWLQAVAAKAAASGVSKAEFLREATRSHQKSQQSEHSRQSEQSEQTEQSRRFKGVTVLRGQYMAQNTTTREYIGTFATALEAARAVADEAGVGVNTLKRKASELVSVGTRFRGSKPWWTSTRTRTAHPTSCLTSRHPSRFVRGERGTTGSYPTHPPTWLYLLRTPVVALSPL